MKENFKNEKGITLVALVITIIVLLILAGVSLSLVAGGNGILGKATNAVDKTNTASAKEQVGLLISDLQTEYYEKKYVNRESLSVANPGDYVKTNIVGKGTADYNVAISGDVVTVTAKKGGATILTGTIDDTAKVTWPDDSV